MLAIGWFVENSNNNHNGKNNLNNIFPLEMLH